MRGAETAAGAWRQWIAGATSSCRRRNNPVQTLPCNLARLPSAHLEIAIDLRLGVAVRRRPWRRRQGPWRRRVRGHVVHRQPVVRPVMGPIIAAVVGPVVGAITRTVVPAVVTWTVVRWWGCGRRWPQRHPNGRWWWGRRRGPRSRDASTWGRRGGLGARRRRRWRRGGLGAWRWRRQSSGT